MYLGLLGFIGGIFLGPKVLGMFKGITKSHYANAYSGSISSIPYNPSDPDFSNYQNTRGTGTTTFRNEVEYNQPFSKNDWIKTSPTTDAYYGSYYGTHYDDPYAAYVGTGTGEEDTEIVSPTRRFDRSYDDYNHGNLQALPALW